MKHLRDAGGGPLTLLFAIGDLVEKRLAAAQEKIEKTTQAILARRPAKVKAMFDDA